MLSKLRFGLFFDKITIKELSEKTWNQFFLNVKNY